jgi:hypothetical protein
MKIPASAGTMADHFETASAEEVPPTESNRANPVNAPISPLLRVFTTAPATSGRERYDAAIRLLLAQAAELKAQGERLQAAIRNIDESHVGLVPIRAEAVLARLPPPGELGRQAAPSLRTVRRHLRAIRAAHRLP